MPLTTPSRRSNLTQLQILYWVGQKLRPYSPLFNTALTFTFHQPLDPCRFQTAFYTLVLGSDSLRTTIQEVAGVPERCVGPEPPGELVYLDFSAQPNPVAAAKEWQNGRIQTPLNLECCLYDTALLKLSDDRFAWYLNLHHLINDAASIFLVFRQVLALYATPNTPLQLPQFETFVTNRQAYENSVRGQKSAVFWQNKLCNPVDPMHFYGRQPIKKGMGICRVPYRLGSSRSKSIAQRATHQTSTTKEAALFATFAALLFALLHGMSGNRRLATIISIHNRPTLPLKNTIGLLMDICPLVLDVAEDDTVTMLIEKVSAEMRHILVHYQAAIATTGQHLNAEVMMNYNHRPALTFDGQTVEQEEVFPACGNDSFALQVHEFAETGEFVLYFDFHTDVFTAENRAHTIALFTQLLDGFLAEEEQPIGRFVYQPDVARETAVSASPHSFTAPRDMLEFQIQHIWQELLGRTDEINVTDSFFEMGGDSWQAMQLFVRIEKLLGHYLPMSTLLEANTIEALAKLLRRESDERYTTLVTIQAGEAGKRPFFCVTGAGGNGLVIARIGRYLAANQPIYSFLPPGLVGNSKPLTAIPEIATLYLKAMQTIQPHGPYWLGGYSSGGIVAFEMAQQLTALGEQVAFLGIIDTGTQGQWYAHIRRASQWVAAHFHLAPEQELTNFLVVRDVLFKTNYFIRRGYRHFLRQPFNRVLAWLRGEKKKDAPEQRLYLIEDGFGSHLEDARMMALVEANARAIRSYIPQKYPGRITLFKSFWGPQRAEYRSADPLMGWGAVAAQGVELHIIPGSHVAMVHEPHVQVLGRELRICLEEIEEGNWVNG